MNCTFICPCFSEEYAFSIRDEIDGDEGIMRWICIH